MQAVILAGGLGTRLRPLIGNIPKVMLPVGGKPFIIHLLELLKENGIREIILCTGYLGEQVREYLQDGTKLGVKVAYSEEKGQLQGTGGALKQAERLLDERFYVINGDTYLPIDYKEVEDVFVRRGKKALMVVYDNKDDTGVRNNVELDEHIRVVRYDKENVDSNLKYIDAGVLALKREILGLIKGSHPISLEKSIYPTLVQQGELTAYLAEQRFYDIGTPQGLKAFEAFLERRRDDHHPHPI